MAQQFFITGTDTEIGKTYTAVGLLKAFNQLGYSTIGMKPIASGGIYRENKFYNHDALQLQQAASIQLPYDAINPFVFAEEIAPDIAALRCQRPLVLKTVISKIQAILNQPADIHIIEGVGGWFVPLNHQNTMAEVVQHFQFPVILVVGIRLGCMNHALLTYHALQNAKLPIAGWLANCFAGENRETAEMVKTLNALIAAPYLGLVRHQEAPEKIINMDSLINNYFSKTFFKKCPV